MLYIGTIYHRHLNLQKAVSGPQDWRTKICMHMHFFNP
jgi:hypothetical protein